MAQVKDISLSKIRCVALYRSGAGFEEPGQQINEIEAYTHKIRVDEVRMLDVSMVDQSLDRLLFQIKK